MVSLGEASLGLLTVAMEMWTSLTLGWWEPDACWPCFGRPSYLGPLMPFPGFLPPLRHSHTAAHWLSSMAQLHRQ